MHLPPELLQQITAELRADEDDRKRPYDDVTGKAPVLAKWAGDRLVPTDGKLTVGIGINLTDNDLSDAVRSLMFREHVEAAHASALRLFPAFDAWTRNRQAAAVNLAFNLGEAGLRNFVNTTKAMRENRWHDAASGLEHSLWFTQVQKSRRERVVRQVREG